MYFVCRINQLDCLLTIFSLINKELRDEKIIIKSVFGIEKSLPLSNGLQVHIIVNHMI